MGTKVNSRNTIEHDDNGSIAIEKQKYFSPRKVTKTELTKISMAAV